MKLGVVLPTYNEAKNISVLISQIFKYTSSQYTPHVQTFVIVVDDNSPDGTAAIVKTLARKTKNDPTKKNHKKNHIILIHRKGKLGLGTAYLTGFKKALALKMDYIITMDSDLSHDPAALPLFIAKLKDVDIVLGARYIPEGGIENWNWFRRSMSRGANAIARLVLGFPTHDVTSGYRCYAAKVLRSLPIDTLKSSGYSFLQELLFLCYKAGFTVGEVPIIFYDRAYGVSKLGKKEIINFFITLFRLKFHKLYK